MKSIHKRVSPTTEVQPRHFEKSLHWMMLIKQQTNKHFSRGASWERRTSNIWSSTRTVDTTVRGHYDEEHPRSASGRRPCEANEGRNSTRQFPSRSSFVRVSSSGCDRTAGTFSNAELREDVRSKFRRLQQHTKQNVSNFESRNR